MRRNDGLPPRWAAVRMARAIGDLQKLVPIGMSARDFRQQDGYLHFLYAMHLLEFDGEHIPSLPPSEFRLTCNRPNLLASYTPSEVRSWLKMLANAEMSASISESLVLHVLRNGALENIAEKLHGWPR